VTDRARLPTFLVIGAMKAGTTSLHRHLGLHPEIGVAAEKELQVLERLLRDLKVGAADPRA
jgi:hypothetical protein